MFTVYRCIVYYWLGIPNVAAYREKPHLEPDIKSNTKTIWRTRWPEYTITTRLCSIGQHVFRHRVSFCVATEISLVYTLYTCTLFALHRGKDHVCHVYGLFPTSHYMSVSFPRHVDYRSNLTSPRYPVLPHTMIHGKFFLTWHLWLCKNFIYLLFINCIVRY